MSSEKVRGFEDVSSVWGSGSHGGPLRRESGTHVLLCLNLLLPLPWNSHRPAAMQLVWHLCCAGRVMVSLYYCPWRWVSVGPVHSVVVHQTQPKVTQRNDLTPAHQCPYHHLSLRGSAL